MEFLVRSAPLGANKDLSKAPGYKKLKFHGLGIGAGNNGLLHFKYAEWLYNILKRN